MYVDLVNHVCHNRCAQVVAWQKNLSPNFSCIRSKPGTNLFPLTSESYIEACHSTPELAGILVDRRSVITACTSCNVSRRDSPLFLIV